VSKCYIPSGAGHPAIMEHPMEPRWIFPQDAVEILSMEICSPFWSFKVLEDFLTRRQLYS